jgi:hypothetical protein
MNGAEKKLGHYYYIHRHCHYYQRQKLDSCEHNAVRYIHSIPKVPLLHMEIMKLQLYSVLIHACTARVKYHWWTPFAPVYWHVHHHFHDKELFVSMCGVELPQQCVPNSFFKFLSWTVQLLGDLLFDESPYIVHCHRTADPDLGQPLRRRRQMLRSASNQLVSGFVEEFSHDDCIKSRGAVWLKPCMSKQSRGREYYWNTLYNSNELCL